VLGSGLHKLPPYKLLLRELRRWNYNARTGNDIPARWVNRGGLGQAGSFPVAMQPYDDDVSFSLPKTTT
jgi:hypothetical protein